VSSIRDRISRAAAQVGFAGVVALVVAVACGRDVTGTGAMRGLIVFKPSYQTVNINSNGDNVTALRIIISVVTPGATASSATTSKVIADVTPNLDSLQNSGTGGDQSDTVGVVQATFPLQGAGVTYSVVLKAIDATGDTTYTGSTTFASGDVGATGTVVVQMRPVYIGPGSTATRVVASPRSITLIAFRDGLNSAAINATAFDASGATLAQALFGYTVADTTVVGLDDSNGTVHALNKRGTTQVTVTAKSATNPSDVVTVSVTFPAQGINLVSGGNQSAPINTRLTNPVVVKAVAQDGVPVPGTPLNFSAGGGSVSPSTAVTDANGLASVTWTLGAAIGQQSLNVSSPNVSGTTVNATGTSTGGTGGTGGTSGTISVISGTSIVAAHGTSTNVTVSLDNSAGGPAQGIIVAMSVTGGGGSLSSATVTTNASGQASLTWTFGPSAGTQQLSIFASGFSPNPLILNATATAASAERRAP
jgi:hypothetical protein